MFPSTEMFRCLHIQPNSPNIMVTVQRIGHFCCLILLKNLAFCNAGLVVTSEFTHQSRFDNIYIPFPLMTTKSVSLLKCVVKCQFLPGCQSVRYHVISRVSFTGLLLDLQQRTVRNGLEILLSVKRRLSYFVG